MELTIDFMKNNWEKFNKKYFANSMTMPAFKISHAKRRLGGYSWRWKKEKFEEVIQLSDYFLCSEHDYCNTLLHEMVHQYIRQKNLCPPNIHHGYHFYRIAERINRDGWEIMRVNSRKGYAPRIPKDNYHLCAFKDGRGRYFMFRYHPNQYGHFLRLVIRHSCKDIIWFTSKNAKKYDSFCECRKLLHGQYLSSSEYWEIKRKRG